MAIGCAMQVATGVVAGADDVIDPQLQGVCLLAIEPRLMAALEPLPSRSIIV